MTGERQEFDRSGVVEREAQARQRALCSVTLLRHGEPDWAPGGGPSVGDPALTRRGLAQARAAGQALAHRRIDAIYVSPLQRAQETAAPLAETTGLEPVTIDALAEIQVNLGGKTQEQVEAYFTHASGRPLREHWDGWPGGESFRDFHARVAVGGREVLARHGIECEQSEDFNIWHVPPHPQSIVVVAHGGTNAVLLTHLLDVQPVPWEWTRFEGALAGYSFLSTRPIGNGGHVWSLENFNEMEHLRAAALC